MTPFVLTLEIRTGNDAMRTRDDVADALRKAADAIALGYVARTIRDGNGNTVGSWVTKEIC